MHEHRFILDVTHKNRFWVCSPEDKSCCDVSLPMIAGGDPTPFSLNEKKYFSLKPEVQGHVRLGLYDELIWVPWYRRMFCPLLRRWRGNCIHS